MSEEADALKSDWGSSANEANEKVTSDASPQRTGKASWEKIRDQYANREVEQRDARHQAVGRLQKEHDLVCVSESETLYRYDPDVGFYRDDGEKFVRMLLEKRLEKYNSRTEAGHIVYRLKHQGAVSRDSFGPSKFVCLENGVLNVREPANPVLEDHDPKYLFARQWPVSYDSAAECPRFKQFLNENVAADDLEKLQEFVGYTVIHHWGQPYKKALLLLGPTDSGKSTFLNIVEAALGVENVANESFAGLVDGNFATAQLAGKLANIYADVDSKLVRNIGLFKSLTGNDRISASKKYQSKFTFRPTQKLLFAANDVPNIENADDAFYNRWLDVRFPERVPKEEQDQQLEQKLIGELPGILNWALEGYCRLRENEGFTNERSIGEKRSFWKSYSESVEQFVENGPVELQPEAETPKAKVYGVYQEWSEERDHPVKAKQTLGKVLKRKYGVESCYPTIDDERVYCYRGIAIVGDGKAPDSPSSQGWGVDEE